MTKAGLPTRGYGALLACLLLSTASLVSATDCNCERLSLAEVLLVCGDDGLTYSNPCLAECQGVGIVDKGPCGGREPPFSLRHLDTDASIPSEVLGRFKEDGFRFIAKLILDDSDAVEPGRAKGMRSEPTATAGISALRITPKGFLYALLEEVARKILEDDSDRESRFFEGSLPNDATVGDPFVDSTRGRKLKIVGVDDRKELTSKNGAHNWPWRTVGHVRTGCSGALIAPSTVLTAGHCVWSTATKTFYSKMSFMPDRHDGGAHCNSPLPGGGCAAGAWSPDRTVAWTMATTWFNHAGPPVQCDDGTMKCQYPEDFIYDVAIIQLAEAVGNEYGWLAVGYDCGDHQYTVRTAGYPGDLPDYPRHMYWTLGTLDEFDGCTPQDDTDGYISSDLDTAGGQSGSAIWQKDNKVIRAIHVSSGPGHRSIVKWVFNFIKANLK